MMPEKKTADALRRLKPETVIAGIRPQNLCLGDGPLSLSGNVAINEYLGERSLLTIRNGTVDFQAVVPPGTQVSQGETVRLGYEPSKVMVFDSETEILIA